MSENQQALEQAYQLIEAGQLGEARGVLEGVLAKNQNSADAWWLYAHAVEDPQQAVKALENVKRLDPTNNDVNALLQTARQQAGVEASPDEDFDIDFDDDDLSPVADDAPDDGRRRTFIILGAIVGLVLLGVIILIASPRGGDKPATTPDGTFVSQGINPTATTGVIVNQTPIVISTATSSVVDVLATSDVIQVATPNTDTSQIIPTNTATVPVTNEISVEAFLASLSMDYPTNGTTETVETVLGATLLVPMCTVRGDTHTQLIPSAMNGLSQHINQLPSDYVGVGVRFLDCSTNETINVMVVPSLSALEYANNDLSEQDFRRAWRVVDA